MRASKDTLIIGSIVLVLIAGASFYYLQFQRPIKDEEANDHIERIATLTIINEHLDSATLEQFKEQFEVARKRFLQKPNDIEVFFAVNAIGRIKQDVGDYEGAEEAFLYAYGLDSGGYIIKGNLANLYQYGLKDYQRAEQFYLDALAMEDIQEGNHYTYFAELYELYFYRIEDTVKAKAVIERALEELPGSVKVLSLAAGHYKATNNKDKAREMYNAILHIDPSSIIALDGLKKL